MSSIEIFTLAEARDYLDKKTLSAMAQHPGMLLEYGLYKGSLYLGGLDKEEGLIVLVRADTVTAPLEKRLRQLACFLGFRSEEALARFLEQARLPLVDEENPSLEQECYLSLKEYYFDVSYWLRLAMGGAKEHTEKKPGKLVASIKILQLSSRELERLIAMETQENPAFELEEEA